MHPSDEPLPRDPETLQESVARLSAQSDRLRKMALQNAKEAEQISAQLDAIKRTMGKAQDKKTSGRLG